MCAQVTCRAIGIGAYLVRLGQRVIQVENSHIILTGVTALNKVPSSGCVSSMALSFPPLPVWALSLSHGKRWQLPVYHLTGPLWGSCSCAGLTEQGENDPTQLFGVALGAREFLLGQSGMAEVPWDSWAPAPGAGPISGQNPIGLS